MIGDAKVTARAYAQSMERRAAAMQFATATVENGLGEARYQLRQDDVRRLRAQVERDFLVALMTLAPEPAP